MTNAETNAAATVAEQGAHVAPEKAPSKNGTSRKKAAPRGRNAAKGGKAKAAGPKSVAKASKKANNSARTKKASKPRPETKGAQILEMISRAEGVTLAEIMRATDWQSHSVRGFISAAAKKHGIKIESAKNKAGDRVYKIAK